jgi:hypothetical protein
VRVDGSRNKKLIVAFHFQFANRAGWNCDECRKHGLETRRRCGFIAEEKRGNPVVVWGRKRARTEECPKSFITGQSLAWIEEFVARRRLSVPDSLDADARKVDAFLILQREMEIEIRDGQTEH